MQRAVRAASEEGSATQKAAALKGALDWLVPPFFRAAEYLVLLALAARSGVPGVLPAAFGLVAAVAYHHYDTVYRIRGGTGAPPRALVLLGESGSGKTALVHELSYRLRLAPEPWCVLRVSPSDFMRNTRSKWPMPNNTPRVSLPMTKTAGALLPCLTRIR